MKHSNTLYRSAVLAIATAALIGNAALAEDAPNDDAADTSSTIVLAEANRPVTRTSKLQTSASEHADTSGVTEALDNLAADSKIELEMRLSGHKSLFLAAGL